MAETLKIVVLCTLAAVVFGVAHDMVTAHVCVEYFSIGHPNIFGDTTGPAYAYALYWGFAATWWVGCALGVLLAIAARAGSLPELSARNVFKPIVLSVAGVWVVTMLFLLVNVLLGRTGLTGLLAIPRGLGNVADNYLAAKVTHEFSYSAAGIMGFVLALIIWQRRTRAKTEQLQALAKA